MRFGIYLCFIFLPLLPQAQTNLQQADDWYRQKDWHRAATAYQQIVQDNPWNGTFWYRLGWSHFQQGALREATDALARAAQLQAFPANAYYNAACASAKLAEQDTALYYLERAIRTGFYNWSHIREDPDLANLHNLPTFRSLVSPEVPKGIDRAAGWRADLDYLAATLPARHNNLFHTLSPEAWEHRLRDLRESVPQRTDLELIGSLMHLLASIGDGHTKLFPPLHGPRAFRALPAQFGWFRDGLYITKADPDFRSVVGARVTAFGDRPAAEVFAAFQNYSGLDNEWQGRMMGEWYLRFAELHRLEGTATGPDSVGISLEMPNGTERRIALPARPLSVAQVHGAVPADADWIGMNASAKRPLPLWQQQAQQTYWSVKVPDDQLLYVSYRQVRDAPHGPSIREFAEQVREQLKDPEIEALVLDIRENTGGNGFLNLALLHAIIQSERFNRKGKLFVIIGRRTFSAAMDFASKLELHTQALFVGEPTGSRPNFYGEHFDYELPYSGLTVSVSSRYFQNGFTSDDKRPWIAPDLAAPPSAESYRHNVDPAMEVIRKYLNR